VSLGIAVSALSAGFSSFAGLKSLAEVTGWSIMAPLFALCVDAYALTAIRVWLASSTTSRRARVFAKWNAAGAILLSLAGNATWHLIAAGLLPVTWHIVMAVGGVPPIILGLVSHLAVLRRQVDGQPAPVGTEPAQPVNVAVPGDVPGTVLQDANGTRYPSEDELLAAARAADEVHRAATGKPITRDALRRTLRISGTRATAALRRLREEADAGGG
jgi:hypothetical protein